MGVVAAAYIFDEEAAVAVVVKGDIACDLYLHDSAGDVAAYYDAVLSLDVHFHHLPTENLPHLHSQHTHLDTEALCCSGSELLSHVNCKNVDD